MIQLPAVYLDRQGLQDLTPVGQAHGLRRSIMRPLARRCVIIARELTYFVEEEVALTRTADLRAYLRSNAPVLCPFPGWQAVYLASKPRRGRDTLTARTRLRIWFHDPALLTRHLGNTVCFLLPEDLLLALQTEQPRLYHLTSQSGVGYWVHAAQRQLLGSGFLPTEAGSGAHLLADMRELAGITPSELDNRERNRRLLAGLRQLRPSNCIGLIHFSRDSLRNSLPSLRRWAAVVGATVALWLIAGSLLVGYQHHRLQQQQQALSDDLRQALATNVREQQLRERLQALLPLFNAAPRASEVFHALGTIPLEGTRLSGIHLVGEQLTLIGESDSASALLATISGQPWITDARFTTPVSRQRGKDRFNLVLRLDTGTLNAGAAAEGVTDESRSSAQDTPG